MFKTIITWSTAHSPGGETRWVVRVEVERMTAHGRAVGTASATVRDLGLPGGYEVTCARMTAEVFTTARYARERAESRARAAALSYVGA